MAGIIDEVVAEVLGVDAAVVTDDLSFQSIGAWSSLRHVELMLEIESRFGVEVDAEDTVALTTVGAIRRYLERAANPRLDPGGAYGGRAPGATAARGPGRARSAPPPAGDGECVDLAGEGDGARADAGAVRRGLAGVAFDDTHITSIDGRRGLLHHRGYSIDELATRSTFEETTYLLLHGELPSTSQLDAFDAEMRSARSVPRGVLDVVERLVHAHPMTVLRTAASALAAFDGERDDGSAEAARREGVRLIGRLQTVVAAHEAMRRGRRAVPARADLASAANLLWMLRGELADALDARVLDAGMIVHADHGSNASSFAARVATGTGSGLHAAVTAALAAFEGPLHGGASEGVMRMLRAIGSPERAPAYVAAARAAGKPVAGFGHRVYRTEDPRSRHLRSAARRLSDARGEWTWYEVLESLRAEMSDHARLGADVNVDLYTAVVYHLLGIPEDLLVPMFAVARAGGWVAQVVEQRANNVLIRPLMRYRGPEPRPYRGIGART